MSDEFASDVLRISVAQILKAFGFGAAEQTALDTLADIVRAYIEEIGQRSREFSEHACRTEPNYHDIAKVLREMRTTEIDREINSRKSKEAQYVLELKTYQDRFEETSCARTVPAFPLATKPIAPVGLQEPQALRPPHIPDFLPPFPDAHSFQKTHVFVDRDLDPRKVREQKNQQRLQAETNLAKLHQHTVGSEFDVVNYERSSKERKPVPETTPGFAPPREPMDVNGDDAVVRQPRTPPATPLAPESQFIARLYDVPSEPLSPGSAAKSGSTQDEELKQKVDKILALQHKDNMIESVEGPPLRYAITTADHLTQ